MIKKKHYVFMGLISLIFFSKKCFEVRKKMLSNGNIFDSDSFLKEKFKSFHDRNDVENFIAEEQKKEIHIHHECGEDCRLCSDEDLNVQQFSIKNKTFKHYKVTLSEKTHHFLKQKD